MSYVPASHYTLDNTFNTEVYWQLYWATPEGEQLVKR